MRFAHNGAADDRGVKMNCTPECYNRGCHECGEMKVPPVDSMVMPDNEVSMKVITILIEYDEKAQPPAFSAGMELLGGKITRVQFSDLFEEHETALADLDGFIHGSL
jgi:hypothetical protein